MAREHQQEEEEHRHRLQEDQRQLLERAPRCRVRADQGFIVLDDNDEEPDAGTSNRGGDDKAGCSNAAPKDDGGDYTEFYRRLGMDPPF